MQNGNIHFLILSVVKSKSASECISYIDSTCVFTFNLKQSSEMQFTLDKNWFMCYFNETFHTIG
jgi:hypothetical protein